MITDEERQSIINEAVERTLLLLPEVVGNLIMNQVNLIKMNKSFYDKFPDFVGSKDIVASVVEYVEGTHPGVKYEDILNIAAPLIKERIKTVKGLDMKTVSRPDEKARKLTKLLEPSNHGEL